MLVNLLIGGATFGLALWLLVRSVRLGREGKCAGCALKKRCGMTGDAKAGMQRGPVAGGPPS